MKKQTIVNGFITLATGLLLFSCTTNDTAKNADANANQVKLNTLTDSTTKAIDSTQTDKVDLKEREEHEANEKDEKK